MSLPPERIDPGWAWQPFSPTVAQPWDRARAAHLFRRAAFGASAAEISRAVQEPPEAVVGQLMRGGEESEDFSRESDELARTLLSTGDPRQLAAWWAHVLVHTPHPLLERMTLFWHGHFATSAAKVTDAKSMLAQNRLLRDHALGEFRPLVQALARDPAMLVYLDSATNRKAHPNENFARELMELFCLGEGEYAEQDVKELARCFTGWEIKLGKFRFNRFQHDAGDKTVLGKSAPFTDGSAIDWIVDQPQAARFIVGKLYRQFVCDEPAPDPELLEPLAGELREHGFRIGPVVQRIIGSELFFSPHAMGRKVRSPVDLAIGLLRCLEGTANMHQLAADLQENCQGLFYPPNVKGWDGGRAWINSATILGRANMIHRLVGDEKMRFGGVSIEEYFAKLGADEPDRAVDAIIELLLAVPLGADRRRSMSELCRNNADRGRGIVDAVRALAAFPEMQLG